ncbi:MAG: gamma-glutamylcyclotransferase [Gemmatimonadetes bacterium]|nr:gamma-glutamylcyclotransferase [Gemmatimonadota bacterium]
MSGNGRAPLPLADTTFHLFVYGTLRSTGAAAARLAGCELIAETTVCGSLFDIDGRFPALMLYGDTQVRGEVWRCPASLLLRLDEYEGVDRGLFRRVCVTATDLPCWTYVAGAALAHQLTPARRITAGDWRPPVAR